MTQLHFSRFSVNSHNQSSYALNDPDIQLMMYLELSTFGYMSDFYRGIVV